MLICLPNFSTIYNCLVANHNNWFKLISLNNANEKTEKVKKNKRVNKFISDETKWKKNQREKRKGHLRSGTRVVNSSRDEHTAVAVDDDSPVVVADVEGLEKSWSWWWYAWQVNHHHHHRINRECETLKQRSVVLFGMHFAISSSLYVHERDNKQNSTKWTKKVEPEPKDQRLESLLTKKSRVWAKAKAFS